MLVGDRDWDEEPFSSVVLCTGAGGPEPEFCPILPEFCPILPELDPEFAHLW